MGGGGVVAVEAQVAGGGLLYGLPALAAAGEFFLRHVDGEGAGGDVDVDHIAVLDERDVAALIGFGAHMADGQAAGGAGEAAVGDQRDIRAQALAQHGIPLDEQLVEEVGDFEMAAAYEGMNRLLDRREDITAVFAIADSLAVAAVKACHDRGKRVPEDCSFIAIDGIDMSNYMIPTLTTLVQPKEEMGRRSVEILLDMIRKQEGNRHVKLSTTLRPGGSVREV